MFVFFEKAEVQSELSQKSQNQKDGKKIGLETLKGWLMSMCL